MMRTRVLLADRHPLVLEGLKRLLTADFDLVGMVSDGRSLLEAAERLMPDVVLLDISMPLLNGLEAARQLRKSQPDAKVVFLTRHAERSYVTAAFRAGASAYLLKSSATWEVVFAIQQVVRGRFYVTPLVVKEVIDPILGRRQRLKASPCKTYAGNLSHRQREVLQLVAEGHTNKEIAEIISISIKTVEFHKSGLMRKLGLHSTAELTRYALSHGFAGEIG